MKIFEKIENKRDFKTFFTTIYILILVDKYNRNLLQNLEGAS